MSSSKNAPKAAAKSDLDELHELYLKVSHAIRDMPASVKADVDSIFHPEGGGGPDDDGNGPK